MISLNIRFPEKVKDLKTPILIHIIYTYGYYSFNLNEKVISEIRLRIPSIMENFVSQRIMILTSGLALLGKSDNNLFNCIMSNEKLKEIKYSKTFINIAYHIAMTKYDNLPQNWSTLSGDRTPGLISIDICHFQIIIWPFVDKKTI